MATWKIISDSGNNFRFKISDEQLHIKQSPVPDPLRLPSMSDLLLQGCGKLMENENVNAEDTPMFCTGSGKSVAVKPSSVSRALSILGDEDDVFQSSGRVVGVENGFNHSNSISNSRGAIGKQNSSLKRIATDSNSMFTTGSGKAVNISATGLNKAKTLLGLGENDLDSFEGFKSIRKESTPNQHTNGKIPYQLDRSSCATTEMQLSSFDGMFNSSGYDLEDAPDFVPSNTKPPPIKFHTAGGRSISVSTDALRRARSLLGDPELGNLLKEEDESNPYFQVFNDTTFNDKRSITENGTTTPGHDEKDESGNSSSKNFTSPLRSASYLKSSAIRLQNMGPGNNLIQRFNAEADERSEGNHGGRPFHRKILNGKNCIPKVEYKENGICPRNNLQECPPTRTLVDITNTVERENSQNFGEKQLLGIKSSPSPFKKPRISRFITPLSKGIPSFPSVSTLAPRESCLKERVATRYPFQIVRPYIREYFMEAPQSCQNKPENLSDHVKKMSSASAARYSFQDESGLEGDGPEPFYHMLSQSGVTMQHISKEWVANHYKWIVWKLACYERGYPAKFSGKFLTVPSILEELKYRYEREVNYGHRSAIKRILEGDAQSSSEMVLCISSVCSPGNLTIEFQSIPSDAAAKCPTAKIELTDGWYSVYGVLDVLLSRQLAAGKLFVGQKLRIWGAALVGWAGPTSPLEASESTSLQLHMNGTYKAHWADRLGFCKGQGLPLAFRSIKSAGGPVPCTMVGISRVYPVLYRERVTGGGFIVRSERMESKAVHLFNQRCCSVVEEIMSNFQSVGHDQDSEEGAKILNMLETAAEPELLMAEMTTEQLSSFASYRAKVEARRQSDIQRSVEEALEASGLSKRDVSPFMRLRVVGITIMSHPQRFRQQDGLITIWNPTEKQVPSCWLILRQPLHGLSKI
ncbi:hypothetical protein Leryth_004810 [Lithospermum erythrorhizon]|nr:hypothetical protein Leryth_004810 [Lithospermum erythrorhizon]